jgi:nucleoside diphosphate kinase
MSPDAKYFMFFSVEKFYGTHRGRFFYQRLVQYMNSGPVVAVVMQGTPRNFR